MFGNRSEQSSTSADTGWEKWEAFDPVSVHVVPADPPQDSSGGPNEKDANLFEGMQPVITKTAKVR